MARIKAPEFQSILIVVGVGIGVLFLLSQILITQGGAVTGFTLENFGANAVTFFKIIVLTGGLVLGINIARMAGRPLTKRDAFTLILIVAVVWILWDSFFSGLFSAGSLNDISFSVAKKLGFGG